MKIQLTNVRLAFPVLFDPERFQGTGDPAFSASFILEKTDPQVKKLKEAIEQVAKEKWKEKAPAVLKVALARDLNCLHDGDLKANLSGYAGNFYVSSRSAKRPLVIDADKTPLAAADGKPYSGCYVNAIIELWVQDNGYGQRVNASLGGVQFVKDGDAFGGGKSVAVDEFADLTVGETADDLA